ncbi:HAD-IA family hydrolase [Dactylosporangium sp. McL0621]|uniref:HAD-IA family hydrolase n=1 Tax=Dactylosporangium sp. McL0621 TaxID=3415678 RepID=UPI003CF67831
MPAGRRVAAEAIAARTLGLLCAVASSSPRAWVREHLSRVGVFDTFGVIATGDEVPAHKPDPAVYHHALDRLGITGSRAVAVEDTPHCVTAARRAETATVAIPNPFVDVRQFDSADIVLTSAADLPLAEVIARLPSHAADRHA